MPRSTLYLLLFLLIAPVQAVSVDEPNYVEVLQIDGAIGPGVSEYITQGIEEANRSVSPPELILINMNTPGGLSASLRVINLAILASDIPIACFVYPPGSRAASAGTYMLYACHIAAMAPATTLGAATPVQIGGAPPAKEDEGEERAPAAMEKKVLNDAIAYIRGLAQLRGRNAEWAEQAVREAATLTAEEAVEKNVVDLIADSPRQLVDALDGREVEVNNVVLTLATTQARLQARRPDWRNRFITIITDPNIAYILLLIGVYGLLMEFYSPGIGVGGVIGAIALLLALYALHMLPVNYVGVALLLLGIGMLAAEAMMPSFGILGFAGIVAFVIGSIFLLDTDFEPYYQIAGVLIAATAIASTLFLTLVLGMIWKTRRSRVVSGREAIIGAEVEVLRDFSGRGNILMQGEDWQAWSEQPLRKGQAVVVTAIKGLVLWVRAKQDQESEDKKSEDKKSEDQENSNGFDHQ